MPATPARRPILVGLDVGLAALVALLAVLTVRQAMQTARPAPPTPAVLAADPLDERLLAARGLALEAGGHPDLAQAILDFAGSRDWRDQRAQARLLAEAVEAGLWPEAMEHADALLRTDPDGVLRPRLFPWLNRVVALDGARAALIQRLEARRCWWREAWLAQLSPSLPNGGGAGARGLLRALAGSRRPPTPAEYAPFVTREALGPDPAAALADWRAMTRRTDGGPLRDGAFQGASDGTPFTWSVAAGVGATSALEPIGGADEALRVDYDGFSTPTLPAQLVVLAPGAWRLGWRERSLGDAHLAWRVRCASTNSILATSAAATGPSWTDRALSFTIPASGCDAAWLELIPIPGERRGESTAWYTGLSLAPVAARP